MLVGLSIHVLLTLALSLGDAHISSRQDPQKIACILQYVPILLLRQYHKSGDKLHLR